MAAIVATLVYWPGGIALVLLLKIFGISLDTVATFGGIFNMFVGLIVWWLLVFAASCVYAACAFPWADAILEWPRKK